ncbi:MAG: hypothetical protein J2P28_09345 [Actinobacteria bacterium]|nr:hypothetical protein [Actinomycetota bacterium]
MTRPIAVTACVYQGWEAGYRAGGARYVKALADELVVSVEDLALHRSSPGAAGKFN